MDTQLPRNIFNLNKYHYRLFHAEFSHYRAVKIISLAIYFIPNNAVFTLFFVQSCGAIWLFELAWLQLVYTRIYQLEIISTWRRRFGNVRLRLSSARTVISRYMHGSRLHKTEPTILPIQHYRLA